MPIDVTDDGIDTFVNDVHWENASLPILVIEGGSSNSIWAREEHSLKASSSIIFIDDGIETLVNEAHP